MGVPYYCDDWGCAAWVSCKHAFGRSKAYATMDERRRYKLSSIERDGFYDRRLREWCEHYELDKPKPWLMPQPGQITIWPGGSA